MKRYFDWLTSKALKQAPAVIRYGMQKRCSHSHFKYPIQWQLFKSLYLPCFHHGRQQYKKVAISSTCINQSNFLYVSICECDKALTLGLLYSLNL